MLTPEEMDEQPDRIEALFQMLDIFIVIEFAKLLKQACSTETVAEWIEQKHKLLGVSSKAIRKEITRTLLQADKEALLLFEDASMLSATNDVARFAKGGLDAKQIAERDFLKQYVDIAYEQTHGEFVNLGQTIGFAGQGRFMPINDFFYERLDTANMQVMSGTLAYTEAIKQAIQDLTAKGIQTINYDSGYVLNVGSASRMITMTGVSQMENKMNDAICETLGLDLVEVSAHGGARPSHRPWQGKVFSRKGNKGKYRDLAEATGYGTVTGLGGANCRHTFYGYLDGTPRTYTDEELAHLDDMTVDYNGQKLDLYHANQRMRYMERQIRKTKRELAVYDNVDMDDDFRSSSIKLQRMNKAYKEFAGKTGIRPRQDRVNEIMFTREMSYRARSVRGTT